MSGTDVKRLVILAAGRGTRLGEAADGKPKAAVELAGRRLLDWQLAAAESLGFADVTVLRGYRPDRLAPLPHAVRALDNPVFDRTNMVYTLWLSREHWGDGIAIAYGDIVYNPAALAAVWSCAGESPGGIAVAVDRAWQPYWTQRFGDPLIDAETLAIDAAGRLSDIGRKPASLTEVQGQYIGLTCFRGRGVPALRGGLDRAALGHQRGERVVHPERAFPDLYMTDVLQHLIASGQPLTPVFIDGGWLEIDTPADLAIAQRCVRPLIDGPRSLLEITR